MRSFISPFLTTIIFVISRSLIPLPENTSIYLGLTLLIFLHSWFGGFYSGVLATVLTVFATNFFFSSNLTNISGVSLSWVLTTLVFIAQSIVLSFLTSLFAKRIKREIFFKKNLEYKESMLKNIIDSVYGFIVVTDEKGNIIESNNSYLQFQKYSDTLLGLSIFDTYPWKNNIRLGSDLREWFDYATIYGEFKSDQEFRFGSQKKYYHINIATIISDYKGKSRKLYILSGIDITDRKVYEQELLVAKESYRKLVDSNVVGMTIEDSNGVVLEANDAFLKLVGYTLADFTKNKITRRSITPTDYYRHIEQANNSLKQKGFSTPFQKEYIKSNGERVPVLVSSVLIDEKNMKSLSLTVDLTAQQKVMNLKDEFIGVITHELKTPLMTLQGYVDILSKNLETSDPKDLKKFIDIIGRQTERLNKLVFDLIDFIKLSKDKLVLNIENFDIVEFSKRIADEIDLLNTTHKITLKSESTSLFVSADPYRVEQVITNLLTNAIKFSPQDKEIIVIIEDLEKKVKISVTDLGVGISKEDMPLVFNKFFQSKSQPLPRQLNKSMGLGLYISSEIIKKHKGKIGVTSELTKGTTFYFTLPKSAHQ